MIDYIKQNHLSIVIILFLIVSPFIGGSAVGAPSDSTTFTNPIILNQTLTVGGAVTIGGTATFNGLRIDSMTPVSTTTTGGNSMTLNNADLLAGNYNIVNIAQASDFTYTIPATSSMTTFLANDGESTRICYLNATSTAQNIIFAAEDSSVYLQTASSTLTALTIYPENEGCITYRRMGNASGTVSAIFETWGDAD